MKKSVTKHDCPECKKGKIKMISELTDEGVKTRIYDCDNKECGYRVDAEKIMNTINSHKTTQN